jgi:hypothetical protein
VRVNPTSPLEGEVGGEADGWGGGAPTSAGAAIAARRATAASRRADGAHPTPPGPTLIAVPDLATPAATGGREAVTTPAAEELQRRHGAVWELADAGARVEQIAAHLGMPPGHVELILGLRRPLAGGTAGR